MIDKLNVNKRVLFIPKEFYENIKFEFSNNVNHFEIVDNLKLVIFAVFLNLLVYESSFYNLTIFKNNTIAPYP